MIKVLKKLFEPSKAHKYGLDYAPEAEQMYRKIADDLGLQIIKKNGDPVELSMIFPKQNGLRTDVWVCLQNLDELWFAVDGFTCSMFPFEDVKEAFEHKLRFFLAGNYRLRRFIRCRDGKVFKSLLQQDIGGKWQTVSRYANGIGLLPTFFYFVTDEVIGADETDEKFCTTQE